MKCVYMRHVAGLNAILVSKSLLPSNDWLKTEKLSHENVKWTFIKSDMKGL